MNVQNVEAIVVPFNYDLENNPNGLIYDGVFLSNGPGDPSMVRGTLITRIKKHARVLHTAVITHKLVVTVSMV